MDNNIKVTIWGKEVGRLTWDASRKRSIFEYAPSFLKGELDIAPLTASIHDRRSRLPFYGEANNGVFYGLPAFISDSLPGKWGATFAKKSKEYPAIIANGGIKMPFEKQKEYVERLFLPRRTS